MSSIKIIYRKKELKNSNKNINIKQKIFDILDFKNQLS